MITYSFRNGQRFYDYSFNNAKIKAKIIDACAREKRFFQIYEEDGERLKILPMCINRIEDSYGNVVFFDYAGRILNETTDCVEDFSIANESMG